MSRRPARQHVFVVWSLTLLLGACSLPANEGVTPIDAGGLPPEIANTTTTTTTTSTTTTVPPPTSVPPETSAPTTPAPTTAPPASNSSPIDIYYVDRATSNMKRLRRDLLEPVTLNSVITQLEQPPDDLASYDVRTAMQPDLIGPTSLDRSVLTVSLNSSVFDAMNDEEKRLAIAQLVLTFTSFAVPGEGNIGSVIIQVDGTGIPVYLPNPATTVEPGTPVVFDDFASLVVGTGATTTTTSLPTESVPPSATTSPPPG
jgi:hypothetical protein